MYIIGCCEGAFMVNNLSGNLKPSSYGNILRAGNLPNGRVMYNVIDSEGKKAGKLSVPLEEVDTFEASYKQILDTAPKIQAYVKANSSQSAIERRRRLGRSVIAGCGIAGFAIPMVILRKSASITKKILGAVAGIVAGLSAGFIASLGVTTPPGSFEFARARRTLSTLDIQPVLDEQV
jgi:hypothetical protein